jgi:hypothetical protein
VSKTLKKIISSTQALSLIATAMISIDAFASAPLCSEVLQTQAYTAAQLDKAIANIAAMKMQLDIAQSNKSLMNPALRSLQADYPVKYQELLNVAQQTMSEAQLRELISKKISNLQKPDPEMILQKEKQKKVVENPLIKRGIYELEKTGIINTKHLSQSPRNPLIYAPDMNALIFASQTSLFRLDLTTHDVSPISGNAANSEISRDQKKIFITDHDSLSSYDLQSSQSSKIVNFNALKSTYAEGRRVHFLKMSPSESFVLLKGQYPEDNVALPLISVLNIKTGVEVINQSSLPERVEKVDFLDDKTLIAIQKNRIMKIDIATGNILKTTTLSVSDNQYAMGFNQDRSIVTFFCDDHRYSFDSSSMKAIAQKSDLAETFHAETVTTIAGQLNEALTWNLQRGAEVLNLATLEPVFMFENSQSRSTTAWILGVAISPDKSKAALIYNEGASSIKMETWSLVGDH